MERATDILNAASAVLITVAGLYVQAVFGPVLSDAARVLIWAVVLLYMGAQIESGYGLIRKSR